MKKKKKSLPQWIYKHLCVERSYLPSFGLTTLTLVKGIFDATAYNDI